MAAISLLTLPEPLAIPCAILLRTARAMCAALLHWLGLATLPTAAKHMWVRDAFASSGMSREIAVAVNVALQCGDNMLKCRGVTDAAGIAWKGEAGSIDPVTATDEENERLVQAALKAAFPSHEMIGEESAAAGGIPALTEAPTWIVDPIDGTANFVHGCTLSCVSIGLCVGGVSVLGVVYDPYLDELYVGAKGHGARCNGQVLKVDTPSPGWDRALVLIEPGYERSPAGIAKTLGLTRALLEANVQAVRITGSAVLSILWVAAGRANAYVAGLHEKDCAKPWDWCAGHIIATEAGATFARLDARSYAGGRGDGGDETFDIYSRSIVVAGSAQMCDNLRELTREAVRGLPEAAA